MVRYLISKTIFFANAPLLAVIGEEHLRYRGILGIQKCDLLLIRGIPIVHSPRKSIGFNELASGEYTRARSARLYLHRVAKGRQPWKSGEEGSSYRAREGG